MKLEPLNSHYYSYQVHAYNHSFSKPTPERLYIKILKFINDNGPYVRTKLVKQNFPTAQLYPYMLESQKYLEHYREGRYTYWKLSIKGKDLLTEAYNK